MKKLSMWVILCVVGAGVSDRFGRILGPGLGFFAGKYGHFNRYLLYAVLGLLIFMRRRVEDWSQARTIFIVGLYYFVGFYLLSFIHSGSVLLHYYLPFISIPLLLFAGMQTYLGKRIYVLIVLVVISINISHLVDKQEEYKARQGTYFTSWTSLTEATSFVQETSTEKDVGIFVYAPDTYAYAPKYAALYVQRTTDSPRIHINEKHTETYLLYEQAPKNEPWLNGSYWKTDLVDIDAEPTERHVTESGYIIEKYMLSDEEKSLPVDPLALDWVSQR